MTTKSGSFAGPAVTDAVPYAAGGGVTLELRGEWSRAIIVAEVSHDSGATWTMFGPDLGIGGVSRSDGSAVEYATIDAGPPACAVIHRVYGPPGSGLARLRCVEFRSGWCDWTLSA